MCLLAHIIVESAAFSSATVMLLADRQQPVTEQARFVVKVVSANIHVRSSAVATHFFTFYRQENAESSGLFVENSTMAYSKLCAWHKGEIALLTAWD